MDLLTIVILLALGATAVSLVLGIISMERGGKYDDEHGTRFMAMRVGFQGLTLVLLLVALFFARG
jgi:ABC-type dipeptide/oligopeptide/nickel transport system permease subunit